MANHRENVAFAGEMLPSYPLDVAISWIQHNMCPEDVFSDEQLATWAKDMGYVREEDSDV